MKKKKQKRVWFVCLIAGMAAENFKNTQRVDFDKDLNSTVFCRIFLTIGDLREFMKLVNEISRITPVAVLHNREYSDIYLEQMVLPDNRDELEAIRLGIDFLQGKYDRLSTDRILELTQSMIKKFNVKENRVYNPERLAELLAERIEFFIKANLKHIINRESDTALKFYRQLNREQFIEAFVRRQLRKITTRIYNKIMDDIVELRGVYNERPPDDYIRTYLRDFDIENMYSIRFKGSMYSQRSLTTVKISIERVRFFMQLEGLTQKDIERRTGIAAKTLFPKLKSEAHLISLELIYRLARALRVEIQDILIYY